MTTPGKATSSSKEKVFLECSVGVAEANNEYCPLK